MNKIVRGRERAFLPTKFVVHHITLMTKRRLQVQQTASGNKLVNLTCKLTFLPITRFSYNDTLYTGN